MSILQKVIKISYKQLYKNEKTKREIVDKKLVELQQNFVELPTKFCRITTKFCRIK